MFESSRRKFVISRSRSRLSPHPPFLPLLAPVVPVLSFIISAIVTFPAQIAGNVLAKHRTAFNESRSRGRGAPQLLVYCQVQQASSGDRRFEEYRGEHNCGVVRSLVARRRRQGSARKGLI